jgi:hypothetical protein
VCFVRARIAEVVQWGGEQMKVYIAGKITGNENYKAEFAEAEKKLRALGHIPLNPAVLPEGLEKADYMRICLAMLDSADAIALMLNWTGSPGANIELSLAMYTGKKQIGMGNKIGFIGFESIGARGREYGVALNGFGKTVFLTREKAEKALEAMK